MMTFNCANRHYLNYQHRYKLHRPVSAVESESTYETGNDEEKPHWRLCWRGHLLAKVFDVEPVEVEVETSVQDFKGFRRALRQGECHADGNAERFSQFYDSEETRYIIIPEGQYRRRLVKHIELCAEGEGTAD